MNQKMAAFIVGSFLVKSQVFLTHGLMLAMAFAREWTDIFSAEEPAFALLIKSKKDAKRNENRNKNILVN